MYAPDSYSFHGLLAKKEQLIFAAASVEETFRLVNITPTTKKSKGTVCKGDGRMKEEICRKIDSESVKRSQG